MGAWAAHVRGECRRCGLGREIRGNILKTFTIIALLVIAVFTLHSEFSVKGDTWSRRAMAVLYFTSPIAAIVGATLIALSM